MVDDEVFDSGDNVDSASGTRVTAVRDAGRISSG